MITFYKLMALFWTLAEGLLVYFLRWGFLLFSRGDARQRKFLWLSLILFVLLAALLFTGETLTGKFVDLGHRHHLKLYRWALWDFFCTLWVVLEGLIMVYMIRIYRVLGPPGKTVAPPVSRFLPVVPILIVSLFALYAFYQFNLLSFYKSHGLDLRGIHRISAFYIRICGIFWILFEGIAAFLTVKAYFLLKRMGDPDP